MTTLQKAAAKLAEVEALRRTLRNAERELEAACNEYARATGQSYMTPEMFKRAWNMKVAA